jgi:ubiquinone/menaquinone biosynthesis C-methylase UbiE
VFTDRADTFDNLDWVHNQDYLNTIVQACLPAERVLDVGCGTGQIARALAPKVREVVGVDISPEMLAKADVPPNVKLVNADARYMKEVGSEFDCVVARMVFHHIVYRLEDAVAECYRMLRPGGKIVIAEGVPPSRTLGFWYSAMFSLKEERLTFFPEDLEELLSSFKNVETSLFVQKRMSLTNWLDNSGVPEINKPLIWKMHECLSDKGKELYNMVITPDDIFMDWTTCIAVGVK